MSIVIWGAAAQAQTAETQSSSVSHESVQFKQGFGALTLGAVAPLYTLSEVLKPTFTTGALFRTTYGESSMVRLSLDISMIEAKSGSATFWFFRGKGGYDFNLLYGSLIGGGVSMSFVRSQSNSSGTSLMLDDNESDFGLYGVARTPHLPLWNSALSLEGSWEMILTEPEYSHFFMLACVVEVALW